MWAQAITIVLGIWLTAAPAVLGYDGLAADSDHIVGPLLTTFATIAMWEIARSLRWVNLLLAICLVVGPWFLQFEQTPLINSLLVGLAAGSLALVRGEIKEQFGGGWSALWKPERLSREGDAS